MRGHGEITNIPVGSAHPDLRRVDDAPAAGPGFRVSVGEHALAVAGEVDALGAPRLARVLAESPVAGGTCALDLSGLQFADVAGCRAIAGWARALARHGVQVELVNAPPLLRRMWQVLALDEWAAVRFTSAA